MGFYATAHVQPENRYYPVFRTDKSENRLTTIESLPAVPDQAKVRLEFTYDYRGRRVTKTVLSGHDGSAYQQTNEVTFVYDGWNLIAALDEDLVAATISTNFYLWGLDLSGSLQGAGGVGGLLATSQDGASYFACMDGNGNVMGFVDATDGTLAGEYEYGPFGEPLKAHGDTAEENAVRFSSKYTDAESGLLYYGYRYLDPSTGRWLSRDPIGEDGGANLYAFVQNEPIGKSDKLGLTQVSLVSIRVLPWPLFQLVCGWEKGTVGCTDPVSLSSLEYEPALEGCAPDEDRWVVTKETVATYRIAILMGYTHDRDRAGDTTLEHELYHFHYHARRWTKNDDLFKKYAGKCRCKPCSRAIWQYVRKGGEYYRYEAEYWHDKLDCESYPEDGPKQKKVCNDAKKWREKARVAQGEMRRLRDAMQKICGRAGDEL